MFADVTSADTTIVLSANIPDPLWEPTGKFKIGSETIAYTSVSMTPPGRYTFTGVTRGADGTVAAAHNSGDTAAYFSDVTSAITRFVAHEAGHDVKIDHDTSAISLMNSSLAGRNMADPAQHTLRQTGTTVGSLQTFLVK